MANEIPTRVRLGVLDGLSGTLDAVRNKFPQITRAVGQSTAAFAVFDAATSKAKKTLERIGGRISGVGKALSVGITGPVLAVGAFAVHEFMQIEDALADVKGSANLSGEEMKRFGERMGQASKGLSLPQVELLKLSGLAGDIGVRGVDKLEKFTIGIAKLSKITGISAEDSAEDIFKLLEITGEGAGGIDRLGSALAATADKYGGLSKNILESTSAIGREIAKFGLSSAQVVGLAAAVEPLGFNAKQAAGAVGDAFRAIDVSIREGGDKMKGLQAITGMTGAAIKEEFGKNPTEVFRKFLDGLEKIRAKGGPTAKALSFFGASGEKTQIILEGLAKDTGKVAEIMAFSGQAFAENTALTEKYAEATDTFSAKIAKLKNRFGVLAEKLGAALVPYLSKFADLLGGVADFLDSNPGFASFLAVLAGILGVMGPLLLALGFFIGTVMPGLLTGLAAVNAALIILNIVAAPITIPFVAAAAAILALIATIWIFKGAIADGIAKAWDFAASKLQVFIDKAEKAVMILRTFLGISNEGGAFGDTTVTELNGAPGIVPQGAPLGGGRAQTQVNPEFSSQTNNARVDINVRAPQSTSIVGESQGGFMSINRGLAGAF